jgi:hypothetical protein
MLRHATIASFTMLAPQRHSNHAWHAKVLLVKFPQAQQFIDDNLLLREATKLWDKTRLIEHRAEIEIPAETIEYSEDDVAEGIRGKGAYAQSATHNAPSRYGTNQGEWLSTTVILPRTKSQQRSRRAKAI